MKWVLGCFLLLVLTSCADNLVKPGGLFHLAGRDYLYQQQQWTFSGRIALRDDTDSVSASMRWSHQPTLDEIEMAGVFGQGRTRFMLQSHELIIDDGEETVRYIGDVESLVAQSIGFDIPVAALKYWVIGLVAPDRDYHKTKTGFIQGGWVVTYQQMQQVEQYWLPKKIKIENHPKQLKLVIDEWWLGI